jgi:uncharacterized protein Veg
MQQADIRKVRASVHQQCGKKVMIQLDRGRNKVDIQEGVIQNAYPSVFTILVNDEREENPPQLLSFSYSDIITRDIRMRYKILHVRIRWLQRFGMGDFFWNFRK